MKKIFLAIFFFLIYSTNSFSATLWVNPSGSNTSPYDTKAKGATSAATAFAASSAGDTIIYANGTYTANTDRIRAVKSGSDSSHRTIVRAETDFLVILSGMSCGNAADEAAPIAIYQKQYIDIQGFLIKASVATDQYNTAPLTVYDSDYIRVMKVGIKNSGGWSTTAKYAGAAEMDLCTYSLFEDVFASGDLRYGIIMYGGSASNHNIFRRCVVRWDYSATTQPRSSIAAYGGLDATNADSNIFQNCIVIDGNDGSDLESSTWVGGFSAPQQNQNITWYGCISLNNSGFGFIFSDLTASYGLSINQSIVWDNDNTYAAVWFHHLTTTAASGIYDSTIGQNYVRGSTDVSNDVAYRNVSIGSNNFVDITEGTSGNANSTYANASAAGLVYLIKSEVASKGATILYKMGVDGTIWGETGYATLTANKLWPFPNEEVIRSLFRETNDSISGAAPSSNTVTRGFTASGVTLTSYIGNYLSGSDIGVTGTTDAVTVTADVDAHFYGESGETDTVDPVCTISDSKPKTLSRGYTTTLGFTSSDANGIDECKWRSGSAPDESNGTACTGTTSGTCSVTGLVQGDNMIYVGCADPSNNWGSDSVTINAPSYRASAGGSYNIR